MAISDFNRLRQYDENYNNKTIHIDANNKKNLCVLYVSKYSVKIRDALIRDLTENFDTIQDLINSFETIGDLVDYYIQEMEV